MSISSKEWYMPDQENHSTLSRENGAGNITEVHKPNSHNNISSIPRIRSPTTQTQDQDQRKVVRYMECLKNHAAAIGGNSTDGCGEFMPSGGKGTLESLHCLACNCHRNFHRKDTEGECSSQIQRYRRSPNLNDTTGLGHVPHKGGVVVGPELLGYPTGTLISTRAAPHRKVIPYKMWWGLGPQPGHSKSDDHIHEREDGGGGISVAGGLGDYESLKKRFRTKFTQEQKVKMLIFAEKAGWKIQKLEESVVQQFCQEIGIKRRVLKVWMHNNKHVVAKKNTSGATSSTGS